MNTRNYDLTCEICGTEFKGYRPNQHFCSKECATKSPRKKATDRSFRLKRREMLNQIKIESGCVDCGYKEHPAALHFDHVTGEKKFNISLDPKRKLDDILEEIKKCEIVCANCHSIRTFEREQYYGNRDLRSRHRNERV